ncbi:Mu transposase domain-containing protein [Flagellimonas onchidii]|uniref:Mu transposase domain-containing protein n=1 Tax=Flagellimonas onchidii TaxID=2562684 RepID=UPI001F0F9482|nr:hypothetical protein [Allomuricauda onchidii]
MIKNNKYEPSLNEIFADFARHYDTTILPCRAYKPRDKSLVENMVGIVYTRIFSIINEHTYYTLESINYKIRELLDQHNATRLQKRPYSRKELFEEVEKQYLQPLPSHKYELKRYAYATVYKNCFVYLNKDKHYYSVPYQFIGQRVKIIYSNSTVEVYRKYQRIAIHKRNTEIYQYSTIEDHLDPNHQFIKKQSSDLFIEQAEQIGRYCKELIIKVLGDKRHPEQGYKSCRGVLSLSSKVGKQRLENACKRALEYEAYSYMAIKNILDNNLDTIKEEETSHKIIPLHKNIRGKECYQ